MLKMFALGLLLTTLATPSMAEVSPEAKVDLEKIHLNQVELLLRMFKLHNNEYPRDEDGLKALIEKPASRPHWRGPYAEADILKDKWGHALVYKGKGKSAQLRSAGPDGVLNSPDDLVHTI